jgi:hypothetical protein
MCDARTFLLPLEWGNSQSATLAGASDTHNVVGHTDGIRSALVPGRMTIRVTWNIRKKKNSSDTRHFFLLSKEVWPLITSVAITRKQQLVKFGPVIRPMYILAGKKLYTCTAAGCCRWRCLFDSISFSIHFLHSKRPSFFVSISQLDLTNCLASR